MARAKRKTAKRSMQRRRKNSASASGSTTAESLDINSSSDVKKALDIMRKNPLTIVLVFASWCPHCHTYMKRWNEYKSLPNRTSPMISVEQQLSGQLLSEISNENGDPVNVSAYPSVLATTNSNMNSNNNPSVNGSTSTQRSNVGAPVNHSDNSAMVNLLTNGSAALSQPSTGSTASSTDATMNESMDASDFAESIGNNDASFQKKGTKLKKDAATPFRRADLSNAIRKALQATTEKRMRRGLPAAAAAQQRQQRQPQQRQPQQQRQTNEHFVSVPKPEELTMGGGGGGCTAGIHGGPSGLIKLNGGGMAQTNTLFEILKSYSNGKYTRKNIK